MADRRGLPGRAMAFLGNRDGAPMWTLSQTTVAGTSSYTVIDSAAYPFRVIDAWIVQTAAGGASDTVRIDNGSNAITDAMDSNKSDKVITRAGTIDDAYHKIEKGGSLKVTTASDATAIAYIRCVRV